MGVKLVEQDIIFSYCIIDWTRPDVQFRSFSYVKILKGRGGKMSFEYFYGRECEQFTFFRIPKVLFSDKRFKDMSTDAKVLYGLMLDRMGLSLRNRWLDDENRVYIIYTVEDIINDLGCARQKVAKLLDELDNLVGLIERKRQGLGKPNIIYVKNFIYTNSSDEDLPESDIKPQENTEVPESNFLKYENHTSGNMKIKLLEVPKSYSNNTEYSNTEYNDTDNTIVSYQENKDSVSSDAIGWMRERNMYRQRIKRNVEYNIMVEQFEKSWLDEIIELMVDVVCSKDEFIRINKTEYPHEIVKSRFLKINSKHIEYIYFALKENTTKVRNIRAFLITTIYRSFDTADNWFNAKVNYDMSKPVQDWGDG